MYEKIENKSCQILIMSNIISLGAERIVQLDLVSFSTE